MDYSEIYNELLRLMNMGVEHYDTVDLSRALKSSDVDDVESASRILENSGIVRSHSDGIYTIIGDVELMREFILSSDARKPTEIKSDPTHAVTVEELSKGAWTLVEKSDGTPSPSRRRFEYNFGNSSGSNDFPRIFPVPAENGGGPVYLGELIESTIKTMPGYDPESGNFRPYMQISYPDGSPFELRYLKLCGDHYFSDCGGFKRYLKSFTSRLPGIIGESWISDVFSDIKDNSVLEYKDDIVFNEITRARTHADVISEVNYTLLEFEKCFDRIYSNYSEPPANELNDYIVSKKVMEFAEGHAATDFGTDHSLDTARILHLLCNFALVDENIRRSQVAEGLERLIALSREADKPKNLSTAEQALEMVNELTDMEFRILAKTLQSAAK